MDMNRRTGTVTDRKEQGQNDRNRWIGTEDRNGKRKRRKCIGTGADEQGVRLVNRKRDRDKQGQDQERRDKDKDTNRDRGTETGIYGKGHGRGDKE